MVKKKNIIGQEGRMRKLRFIAEKRLSVIRQNPSFLAVIKHKILSMCDFIGEPIHLPLSHDYIPQDRVAQGKTLFSRLLCKDVEMEGVKISSRKQKEYFVHHILASLTNGICRSSCLQIELGYRIEASTYSELVSNHNLGSYTCAYLVTHNPSGIMASYDRLCKVNASYWTQVFENYFKTCNIADSLRQDVYVSIQCKDDQMFGEKTDYISRDETENGNVLLANNPLCSFDTQSGSINEKSFDPKLHSVGKTNRGQVIQFEKIGIQEEGGPFPGHVQIISMATTLSQMSFKDRFECLTSKAFQIVHQDYISDILEFTRAWAQEGKNDIDVNEIVDFLHDVWGRCHDGLQIEWFCRYMLLHPEGIVEKESVERQATKLLNRLTSSSPEENETYTGAFEKLFFMNPERTVKSMVECAFQNKGQQISISTILKECRSFLRVIRSRDGFSVLNGAIMDFLRQIFATDNEHQISYMEPFLRYILLHEVEGQAVPIDDEKSVIDVHELMFNVLLLMSQDDTVPSSAKIELYKNMDWILATYLSTSCSLDKTSSMTSKIERQLSCLVLHVLSSLEKRVEFRDESPCILTSMLDRIKGHILSKPSCCQLLASHLKYYAQNLGYWSWCHIADFFGMIDDHLVESISDAHDTLTLVLSLNSKFPTPDQKVSAFTRFVTFASTSDRSCAQMCKIYTRATSFQHGLGTDTNHGALETDDNHHIVIYDVKELIQVLVQVCQEFVLLLTPDEIKRVLLGFVYKIVRNIVEGLHHSRDQSLMESRIAHDSVRIFLILLKSITKGVVVFSAGQSVPVFYLQSIISIFRDLSKASPVVAYFVFVDALQIISDVPQSWRIYFEPLCLETIEHMQDYAHVKINEITEAITKLKNDEFRSLLILKSVQALQQSQKEAPK